MSEPTDHDLAVEAMNGYHQDALDFFVVMNGEFEDDEHAERLADRHGYPIDDDPYEAAEMYVLPALSFELESDKAGDPIKVARFIFCTGGPHYELTWPIGDTARAKFLSLPWFGRVELHTPSELRRFAEYHDESARFMWEQAVRGMVGSWDELDQQAGVRS